MSDFDWGAIISILLAGVGVIGALVLRLRDVQGKLNKAESENMDLNAEKETHSLSDSDLDLSVKQRLSSGSGSAPAVSEHKE